ncbi:MAG: mCpol domain-containing protein [Planctomycetota bacterium]|nr:MAG: mCpol domain-containing protein [Planctomycetota bacterium]
MSPPLYVLLDGDRVGEKIDGHYLRNDVHDLYLFARELDDAVARLAASIREIGGTIYLAGGDNVLGTVEDLNAFLAVFDTSRPRLPVPFSVGIGEDPRQAHLALRVAKANGFGTVVRAEGVDGGLRFARRTDDGRWVDA